MFDYVFFAISRNQLPVGLQFPKALTGYCTHSCFQQLLIQYPEYASIPIRALSQARSKPVPQTILNVASKFHSFLLSSRRDEGLSGVLPSMSRCAGVVVGPGQQKCHELSYRFFGPYVVARLAFPWEKEGLELPRLSSC